jgi:hypothetical protein
VAGNGPTAEIDRRRRCAKVRRGVQGMQCAGREEKGEAGLDLGLYRPERGEGSGGRGAMAIDGQGGRCRF